MFAIQLILNYENMRVLILQFFVDKKYCLYNRDKGELLNWNTIFVCLVWHLCIFWLNGWYKSMGFSEQNDVSSIFWNGYSDWCVSHSTTFPFPFLWIRIWCTTSFEKCCITSFWIQRQILWKYICIRNIKLIRLDGQQLWRQLT